MVEYKIVLSDPKTGKSKQIEAKDAMVKSLHGKRIGDKIAGELIDMPGFEFEITGGSSNAGFPMRRDIEGVRKVKIYAVRGIGVRQGRRGQKQRKTVFGNTVHEKTAQINMKVIKGTKPLVEEKKEEASKAEEKPAK